MLTYCFTLKDIYWECMYYINKLNINTMIFIFIITLLYYLKTFAKRSNYSLKVSDENISILFDIR